MSATEKLIATAIAAYNRQLSPETPAEELVEIATRLLQWFDRFGRIKNKPWPAHQLKWTIGHEGKELLKQEVLYRAAKINTTQIKSYRKNFIALIQVSILSLEE